MTKVSETAEAIAAVIDAVPDSGAVYDFEPFPAGDWAQYVQKFTVTIGTVLVVRAWTVKNLDRRTLPISLAPNAEVQRIELDWLVKMFLGHNDPDLDGASDVLARDLLETVTEALNANRTLGHVAGIIDHDPADYTLPNNGALVSLGDTVCHYGEVRFTSYHEHQITVI